jgi:hypothetical protein
MAELEKQINRLPHLPKWFVEIPYQTTWLLDHLFYGVLS